MDRIPEDTYTLQKTKPGKKSESLIRPITRSESSVININHKSPGDQMDLQLADATRGHKRTLVPFLLKLFQTIEKGEDFSLTHFMRPASS